MADAVEVATLDRRVAVLEETRSEKDALRHILRKVTGNENLLLETRRELRVEIAELTKKVSALHDEVVLSRASVRDTVAKCVGAARNYPGGNNRPSLPRSTAKIRPA